MAEVKARVTGAEMPGAEKVQPGFALLEDALRAWAERHSTVLNLAENPKWAVAFSGGADSTALLWAAQALWPGRVVALHVHHGIQAAADGFVTHAQSMCERWHIELRVAHLNARPAPGESPEDAARRARYAALARMALDAQACCVLLGQHAHDQLETMLLALSRGAGLPGLAAMPDTMVRHGVVFGRPFLATPGTALREALAGSSIPFVEDPTNSDTRYTRNRIRSEVLPPLLAAFPNALSAFARTARHAAQGQSLLLELAREDLLGVGNPPEIKRLRALSRARQGNLLRYWLKTGWNATPSDKQLQEALHQLGACTTRGHRIRIKVAQGWLIRQGALLTYQPGTEGQSPPI
ncbi:MAG: putative ATPase of the PP-loop superfamily implicated in cell cycle control [Pseudomonadota bacterium]